MRVSVSLFSLLTSIIVFYAVRFIVFSFRPANILLAQIVVLLIATFIVSFIFALRTFKNYPGNKFKEPMFHRVVFQNFFINLVILFVITTLGGILSGAY